MTKSGFLNEDIIKDALNNKEYKDLNSNLKKFIQFILSDTPEDKTLIKCNKIGGILKTDLVIEIKSAKHSVSIKSGHGNSVHQEPLESFITFLKSEWNMPDSIADDIRFFIWGDGTLNNTGPVHNRLSASKLSKQHSSIINNIKNFFNENKKDLINRFVITGVTHRQAIDFIYYGDEMQGKWNTSENVLNWLADPSNESRSIIPVGRLTFQAWNRNINGGNLSEHKRGHIQLKWPSIEEDLTKILRN